MDIIECHFEFSGFDDSLVKAGTSVYLWNLVRQFRDAGHWLSALTPSHGLLKEFSDVITARLDTRRERADSPRPPAPAGSPGTQRHGDSSRSSRNASTAHHQPTPTQQTHNPLTAPLPDAGTGHSTRTGDRIEITWTARNATAVQIINPTDADHTYQLAHDDTTTFTGTIPTTNTETSPYSSPAPAGTAPGPS